MSETQELPRFRITNTPGFFAEDFTLYPQGSEIVYLGTPNEFMEPLNEPAREALTEYLDYLDECHREKLIAQGKPLTTRPRELGDIVEQAMLDRPKEPRVFPVMPDQVPVMAHKRKPGRPPKNASNLVSAKPPPAKAKPSAVPILGNLNPGLNQ